MSDLSRDARDLIAQAKKDGLGPSAADRARVREKLTPLWAANAPSPSSVGSTRRGWPVRLVSVVVIAGFGALSWMYLHASGDPAPQLEAAGVVAVAPGASSTGREGSEPAEGPDVDRRELAAQADVAHAAREPDAPRISRDPAAQTDSARPPASRGDDARATRELPVPRETPRARDADGARATRELPAPREALRARDADDVRATRELPAPREAPRARDADDVRATREARELAAQQKTARVRGDRERAAPSAAVGGDAPSLADSHAPLPRTAAANAARSSTVQSEQKPTPPSIDGELELLSAAQTALQQQRPSRALNLLQEHAFRFPTGALREERMAMQALALCASGRKHAAQSVLSNLEARGAPSQLVPRVRSQCGL